MATSTRHATLVTVFVIVMLLAINISRVGGMRILSPRALESTTPGHSPGIGHISDTDQTSAAEATSPEDPHKFNSDTAGNSHQQKKNSPKLMC